MIAHLSYVMCDRCGAPAPVADDAKEARSLATRAGFVRRNWNELFRDLCPACKDITAPVLPSLRRPQPVDSG